MSDFTKEDMQRLREENPAEFAKYKKQKEEAEQKSDKNLTIEKATELPAEYGVDRYQDIKRFQSFQSDVLMQLSAKKRGLASEMIVDAILNSNKIHTIRDDENQEMWIYNEGIYIPQAKTFIKAYVGEILGNAYTTHFANLVIAKIEIRTYVDPDIFFKVENINEIPVINGILNLKTRELNSFTEDKIFFNKLPVVFDPEAKCVNINKHLNNVLKHKDDISIMYEVFGYLLWKDHFIEKAVMFSGDGRNGKGKTVDLMKRFIGIENCANVPLQQLDRDLFAVAEMFKKMANLSADISPTALKSTGYFKNLTGRDLISAPRKFLPRVHFVSYAKQIFCANTLPKTYDTSSAFWNRWVLLEFPYQFLSQKEIDVLDDKEKINTKLADPNIIESLSTDIELSGLLNKALDGLDRIRKQGDFSYAASVAEVKEMWIRKSDSLSAFLMDRCEVDYDGFMIKTELSKEYVMYCREHKVKPVSDKAIKNTMILSGYWDGRKTVDDRQRVIWGGIRLKLLPIDNESKGSKGSKGISVDRENKILGIDRKTYATLATFTNLTEEHILIDPTHVKCICGNEPCVAEKKGTPICQDCLDLMESEKK